MSLTLPCSNGKYCRAEVEFIKQGTELHAVHIPSEFLAAVSDYDLTGSLIGDKANSVIFDNSKIKRAVPGFTATVRADQGIPNTIRHVLAHPELQKEDAEFDQWCDRIIARYQALKEQLSHE